ncbi:MAG TPA: GUN4 domain-containing protein, partial [Coleofasciculaceae cyanobacterium]
DVEALRRVLQDPNLGGFDVVEPLLNPDPFAMQDAIEKLFAECQKDDLALLFFSGHGITDDNGRLFLTTCLTNEKRFKATSVPASFVHDVMNESPCQRQVVILDCCYSGAFKEGWQSRSAGTIDIKQQLALGSKGRAVLTSSNALQKSFEHEGSGIYTRYLVEGIETGVADGNGNGTISIQELHEYAKEKVQEAKPAMTPEIHTHKEGFNILLAQARRKPEADYRKLVERYASHGEISFVAREILQQKQKEIGITDGLAAEIESQVLEPYRKRLKNLERYREAFKKAVEDRYPLAQKTRDELKDLQYVFGLRDQDVELIQEQITADKEAEYQQQQEAQKQPSTPKISSKPLAEADDLSSDKGVDYTKLRDLLAQGKWQEADEETLLVMLKVAGREQEGWLRVEDIENFPCTDLRTIDTLWGKYSNGRFSFSVHKRIWVSVGGTPDADYETFNRLADRIKWRVNNYWLPYAQLTFTKHAPEGHLPSKNILRMDGLKNWSWRLWVALLSRRDL